MRRTEHGYQFSPSDIIRYLDGHFAAWMDRYHEDNGRPPDLVPDVDSPEDALVKAYGMRHEKAHLEALRHAGTAVTEIPGMDVPDAERVRLTRDAMARGDRVIYQAALEAGDFFGYADFLHRRDNPDGTWHYEPWDTKLARSIKPKFIVQLCAYADMLGAMHGTTPVRGGAVLGSGEHAIVDLSAHWHTWEHLKAQFLEFQRSFNQDDTPPDAALEREHGRWSSFAQEIIRKNDLVNLAAGITMSQVKKLRAAGVVRMSDLAARANPVPKMAPVTLTRLVRQARLQVNSRGLPKPLHEVIHPSPAEPRRGLALLPPESPGDVYFDIEGFPYAQPDGLEYLLGAMAAGNGEAAFHDWWAHDAAGERRAFEAFMDWAWQRFQADPGMHIYHYAAYEVTALKRLAMRYGSREEELDTFLRCEVFVDLYTVLRQGVAVGAASYSLKDIEALYLPKRAGEVVSAMGSVVAYEDWLASGEPANWQGSPKLAGIREYNRADCESTMGLTRWLRERQVESGIAWEMKEAEKAEKVGRADRVGEAGKAGKADEGARDGGKESTLLAESLRERAREAAEPEGGMTRLVAALVEYHRREDKPAWWDYFRRQRMEEDELADDLSCLAGLTRTSTPPRPVKRSKAWAFSFDPDQDTKVRRGKEWELHHDPGPNVEVVSFDGERGILELKTTADAGAWPERIHLVPGGPRYSGGLSEAMLRFGATWSNNPDAWPAIADLLNRRPPRLDGGRPSPLVKGDGSTIAAQVTALVRRLDGSVLCIQGPPGTGKSSVAARVIANLLKDGKKVAITGQSHKVIINLMEKSRDRMKKQDVQARLIKVGGDEAEDTVTDAEWVKGGKEVASRLGDGAVLVGTTVYGLAQEDLAGAFDYVFIDEAGQYALANAVIAGIAARNIVLIGDQNQLPQVVQGVHPDGSGASALEHMLQGQATVDPGFGVLLDTTWRLHPAIGRWVSEAFYGGRLQAAPQTETGRIEAVPLRDGHLPSAGIVYLGVPHTSNTQDSPEEAHVIAELVSGLVGRRFTRTTNDGTVDRPLTLDDILIVAPYNMQVRLITEQVPGARVASVDKFQGQEAPVVIVSMCASSLEGIPRGAAFLLDPNRLNVAVSRAQVLAIVVAAPGLLRVRCKTIPEMLLMNRHCWLAQGMFQR